MKQYNSEGCKLSNPFFIATVEDNNDPTFNYRVKVRHPVFHPDIITTEQLPWAARIDSTWFGISDDGDICHRVPDVGSQVLCMAIANNLNSLVYIGNLYKKTNNTPTDNKYLQSYGIYGKDGHFIGIDKIEKTFKLIYEGKINIDKIQDMTINVSGNVNLTATTTTITGDVKIDGKLDVTGIVKSDEDVKATSISLKDHTHNVPGTGLTGYSGTPISGTATSEKPQ